MHYKNGRVAKVGDAVFGTDYQGFPLSGVVVRTVPDAKSCNIHIVPTRGMMPAYNSNAFLHAEDALEPKAAVEPLHIPPPLNYQQRVIQEREELEGRLAKLQTFIAGNTAFPTLPEEEQQRLRRQFAAMLELSDVLRERIAAFPPPPPSSNPQTVETPPDAVPADCVVCDP